jgi:hypothetical protein
MRLDARVAERLRALEMAQNVDRSLCADDDCESAFLECGPARH